MQVQAHLNSISPPTPLYSTKLKRWLENMTAQHFGKWNLVFQTQAIVPHYLKATLFSS